MNLVPENLNEAIKHLKPRSEEELYNHVEVLEKEHNVSLKDSLKFIKALRKIGLFVQLDYTEDTEFYFYCQEFIDDYMNVYLQLDNGIEEFLIFQDDGRTSELLLDGGNWKDAAKIIEEEFPVNESIKHLKPKSEEELRSSVKNLTLKQKFAIGIEENLEWLVKETIEEGIDVNELCNFTWIHNADPLTIAILSDYDSIVKILLEAGAYVTDEDIKIAIRSGYHPKILKLLRKYKKTNE
jgi:hypothetical protein